MPGDASQSFLRSVRRRCSSGQTITTAALRQPFLAPSLPPSAVQPAPTADRVCSHVHANYVNHTPRDARDALEAFSNYNLTVAGHFDICMGESGEAGHAATVGPLDVCMGDVGESCDLSGGRGVDVFMADAIHCTDASPMHVIMAELDTADSILDGGPGDVYMDGERAAVPSAWSGLADIHMEEAEMQFSPWGSPW